jgi:GNAT superfamily N-acetyltransferase
MNGDSISVTVRLPRIDEVARIETLLLEATSWLNTQGMPMWLPSEVSLDAIFADVRQGLFFVVEHEQRLVAAVKFQLDDPLFWPDVPNDESAFIHRFVVSREYAGRGFSTTILKWAADRARKLGKRYLRLDCEASRPKLRALYEKFGFRHHSDRQVERFHVSRYEYVLADHR